MPSINSGKVLVTGVNGYVAAWVAKVLLEHGFSIRGTVRALGKGKAIQEALKSYGDKFELSVVEDITADGVFDEAVRGVDGIVHAASPIGLVTNNPDEYIVPAVRGTTTLLRSASLPGSSVKRIIYVSSLAAVLDLSKQTPRVFTETDWNESAVAEVKEQGRAVSEAAMYRASKTLAEKAAWDVYREGRANGTIGWDLVTICLPWVFGPTLGASTADEFTSSMKQWYQFVVKEEGELPTWSSGGWIDVRDMAQAHLLALTKPEAGGERFIISAGPFLWSDWVAIARRLSGKQGAGEDSASGAAHEISFDSTKSRQVLGLQYRSMEETTAYLREDLGKKGLWP